MEEEDRAFRLYLEAHGFDTSLMGIEDEATPTIASHDSNLKEPESVDEKVV
ncbi:hypothetical protein EVJ58_g5750 [Rhodofomes roseus]|nr:hypothetical protein EVJ58_g5750 [Rhodofomes roseus]